jgi:D-glycero-alpha-D-manno-heptose-7-phosphate kinase
MGKISGDDYLISRDARTLWERPRDGCEIIRAKAPLRVSFAGGGTDVPEYYEKHGGAVLSTTINHFAYVSLYPRDDTTVSVRSMDLEYSVKYDLNAEPQYDGALDIAKATIRRLNITRGFSLDIRSDAPPGSGLGGSSALTAAIIGALAEFAGVRYSSRELAELNYLIERIDLKIAGGKQDQYATTYGGFNVIQFAATGVSVSPLRLNQSVLDDLEAHLLLCYSGIVRGATNMIEIQMDRMRKKEGNTFSAMARIYKQVDEMREALERGDLRTFGGLLHAAYEAKREMNPYISAGTNADALYNEAMKRGALGGKLLGAGGGGYLAFYVPTENQHEVRSALEKLGGQFVDFGFDQRGLRTWRSNSP